MLLPYVFFAALKGLCEPMAVYWRLFRLLYSTDNGPKNFSHRILCNNFHIYPWNGLNYSSLIPSTIMDEDGGVNLFSRIYPFCYLYVTLFSKEDH
jgi:hypothetical protein